MRNLNSVTMTWSKRQNIFKCLEQNTKHFRGFHHLDLNTRAYWYGILNKSDEVGKACAKVMKLVKLATMGHDTTLFINYLQTESIFVLTMFALILSLP